MKCSKCGAETKNFPEHLADLVAVVCAKCIGDTPKVMDMESLREKYMGRKPRLDIESDEQVAA